MNKTQTQTHTQLAELAEQLFFHCHICGFTLAVDDRLHLVACPMCTGDVPAAWVAELDKHQHAQPELAVTGMISRQAMAPPSESRNTRSEGTA